MIRGTTPTLEFTLPFDTGELDEAYVSFAQRNEVVLEKTLSECECIGNKMIVRLSQEDTLKLRSDQGTEIQIRARTKGGEALASNIMRVSTERILKDGVI